MAIDRSLSVLVIDEETEVLSFLARVLDTSGMRALLAHNANEAIGIAQRGYVPIDLILTNVIARPDPGSGSALFEQLRDLRPNVRVLYMSARVDSGVIRIELMDQAGHPSPAKSLGLIESIRTAAAPLTRAAGGLYTH